MFFVESNGEEPVCPVCGSGLKYRDQVPRIMKGYMKMNSGERYEYNTTEICT